MSEKLLQRLDEYIEYAEAAHRFSDVGFYEDLKAFIEDKNSVEYLEGLKHGAELVRETNEVLKEKDKE